METLRMDIALRDLWFTRFGRQLADEGRIEARFGPGEPGTALLGTGWSTPESWGVWSDGAVARLRLPFLGQGSQWRVTVRGGGLIAGLGDGALRRFVVAGGPEECELSYGLDSAALEFHVIVSAGEALEFRFPDAASLVRLGLGAAERHLGIGLHEVVVQRSTSV